MKRKIKQNQIQEGIFHVYSRGNNRRAIFYTDYHRYQFLRKCDRFAKKHNTKILAFVLMQNHYHLVVSTESLSLFMRDLQQNYSQFFNKDQGEIGTLLGRFGSALLRDGRRIERAIRYVLQNPIKAGMVDDPKAYLWSSYSFYYSWKNLRKAKTNYVSKKTYFSKLSSYIEVDTEFVENYYSSKEDFRREVLNVISIFEQEQSIKSYSQQPKEPDQSSTKRISDSDAMFAYKELLQGRNKDCLTTVDVEKLIHSFRHDYGATAKQISRIMHEPYKFVCRAQGAQG